MTGVSRRKITLFFIRDYKTEKINLPFKDAHAMSIKHMHAEVSGNSFAEIFLWDSDPTPISLTSISPSSASLQKNAT